MANVEQLALLKTGAEAWNRWRDANPDEVIDLTGVDLRDANLACADLNNAVLADSNCSGAIFQEANLNGANLQRARIIEARFSYAALDAADLTEVFGSDAVFHAVRARGTIFRHADLESASFVHADCRNSDFTSALMSFARLAYSTFTEATLTEAVLEGASFYNTKLDQAVLKGCLVHGCSVWGVDLDGADQSNLVITDDGEPRIQVDNLEVAQFIYLLLNNRKVRHVIDTITSKVVLILGRFTPERNAVLDAIRDELRNRDYLPVLFDFEKPSNRDITETVSTLAHMARFVIADLSDPRSVPHELAHVTPLLPSVPIMPLIVRPQKEYAMFEHFFGFRHVLKPLRYRDERHLLSVLNDKVIAPAEKLAQRVAGKRARR